MSPKVNAVVLKEFGKLEIVKFPYPQNIEPGALVVDMLLAGICGTDKHIFEGKSALKLPVILGHENLGCVERLPTQGPAPTDVYGEELRIGERITWFGAIPCGKCWYCKWLPSNHCGILCSDAFAYGFSSCIEPPHLFGGYAEKVYLKPRAWIWKIPEYLPDKVAILTDIMASVSGVIKAMTPDPVIKEGFGPGDIVAIQGAGPIGIAAGLTARLCGAYKIILIGGPRKRLQMAENLGIFDEFICIEEVSEPKDRINIVQSLTPGNVGPDLVVDCSGMAAAVPEGLDMVRRGGTFVEIGSFVNSGETSISPFRHLCWKDVRLIGQYGCTPQYYDRALKLLELAWRSNIPLESLVSTFRLEEAQAAMDAVIGMEGMKIVFDFRKRR